MRSHFRRRRGVTMVEMMVVIAVAIAIFAFLFVGVQQVREAANRAICANNLKQMGSAFQHHHDVHGVFPSGGTYWYDTLRVFVTRDGGGRVPAVFDTQSWGWGYQILPYLGLENLWANPDDNFVGDTPMPLYNCPSARPLVRFRYTQAGANTYRYMWDYSGNGGSWGNWPNLTTAGNALDGPIVPSRVASGRSVAQSDIFDGASNTFLIGEKYLDKYALQLTPICSDDQGWIDGWDNDAIAFCKGTSNGNSPTLPKRYDNSVGCGFYFGACHIAMNSVFCDGSVRPLRYNLDNDTWLNLCRIADGNPLRSTVLD